jgi:rhodanese-related sulfurtransferase
MILIFVVIGGILYYIYDLSTNSKHRISSETAKKLLSENKFDLVLDVRTALERNTLGSYPRSVHIQTTDLEKEMSSLYPDKSIRILVYCNTGPRARVATDKLQSLGYTNSVYISTGHNSIL